jgi:S-formylglutathione hydrolase FrmB
LLPVLYLLHGLSDDHTIWQRRTSIERYAASRRLAVVMPAVNRSFYTDQKHGYKYWTFISDELPGIVQTLFRISARREDTFVAGLSMGGYGALKLGLRCPDRYAAAASLSGVTDLGRLAADEDPDRLAEGKMIFGSLAEYLGSDDDLFALAEKTAQPGISKPKLFMACGTDDFLYQDNLAFRPHLEKLGYDLAWSEKPGATHEWGYWDEMIQQVLDWLPLGDRHNG